MRFAYRALRPCTASGTREQVARVEHKRNPGQHDQPLRTPDFATAASGLRLLGWRQRWAPRIPVLRERPEKRQQSCQFGVYPGNVDLTLRLQR